MPLRQYHNTTGSNMTAYMRGDKQISQLKRPLTKKQEELVKRIKHNISIKK